MNALASLVIVCLAVSVCNGASLLPHNTYGLPALDSNTLFLSTNKNLPILLSNDQVPTLESVGYVQTVPEQLELTTSKPIESLSNSYGLPLNDVEETFVAQEEPKITLPAAPEEIYNVPIVSVKEKVEVKPIEEYGLPVLNKPEVYKTPTIVPVSSFGETFNEDVSGLARPFPAAFASEFYSGGVRSVSPFATTSYRTVHQPQFIPSQFGYTRQISLAPLGAPVSSQFAGRVSVILPHHGGYATGHQVLGENIPIEDKNVRRIVLRNEPNTEFVQPHHTYGVPTVSAELF